MLAGVGTRASGSEAFSWSQKSGYTQLGDLPGGLISSRASGMSASGAVIIGTGNNGISEGEAFRWTAEHGIDGLGFLPGGSSFSGANAVSGDGSRIVGVSDAQEGSHGYLWTELSGMISLGAGFDPLSISFDGSTIVGYEINTQGFREGLIWREGDGLQNLQDLLIADFLLDLTGWTLEAATDISADGRTIVGYGINPDGFTEGWIAVIPEPPTLALVTPGLWLLRRRHGVRQR